MTSTRDETAASAIGVLAGGGEMGALMRAHDWAATPLGPVDAWPQSLRTAVDICLASRFPMLLWWGPELVMLYNDAYRPILGATKHPAALGQRGRDCWPEIWDVIGPMLEGVLSTGAATWSDDQLLLLDRNGYVEECYFTFSYSPIRDESGGVGGIFTAVTETTARVLGERRLRSLRELAARTAEARTVDDACTLAASALCGNPADVPFALLYLRDAGRDEARLAATVGLDAGTRASPFHLGLAATGGSVSWPCVEVARTGQPIVVEDLAALFVALTIQPDTAAPRSALVLPVTQAGQEQAAGFLVCGISSQRALDDEYRGFFSLVAGQIATAITDARAYEAERQRAEALAELDRAKTAFFSNVSHEFRTPLTLLLGPLEEALTDTAEPLPARQRERLAGAHRNSLRLLRLVNTLLDFARIEAGRAEASYEPTDLAAYTAELASAFHSAADKARLRQIVDCPPLPEPVYVDRTMWEKIVLNLLSNAFKFTFEGEIAISLCPQGDAVELTVRDTGTGIPAEELPHLFERFHRVRGARARTHEGTGIGLALVQELVRLHGGAITVESAVDVGTTFTVRLPLGAAHLPAERIGAARTVASTALGAAPYVAEALRWLPDAQSADVVVTEAAAGAAVLNGEGAPAATIAARVLLADDNADMRAYVRRLLGARYDIEAVADGAAALAAAQARRPDLVLADVMMPGLDGFALLHALRADARTCEVPIILLSARAGEEATAEGLEAGADDYLVKPFAASELLARVQAHVALARLRQQAMEAERAARAEAEAERRRTEELAQQIQTERDRVRQVLNLLPEAVVVTDTALTIQFSNRAVREILGRAAAEPPDHVDAGHDVPADDGEARAAYGARRLDGTPYGATELPLARAVLQGEVVRGEQMLLCRADGRDVPILVNAAPLRDAEGTIIGGVVVFQDITALHDLERAREEFLSSAAHDLKTPLTSIRGQAQLAQRRLVRLDGPDAAKAPVAAQLALIQEGSDAMLGLINELVDVTRQQMGGGIELQREPVDLVALVRDSIAAQGAASGRAITLEADTPELRAEVDAARLTRVIGNLLSNALKYSSAGGAITVSLTRDADDAGSWALIAVHDEGIGIPTADLPYIFDRFHRASNVGRHIPGTGIGLASARQIVEQHGGTITAQSAEGAGATFIVRLPLRPEPVS